MAKRGRKPKARFSIKWSPSFAYGIGLIVSDGNVSSDGRHITFTSKEKEMIDNFKKAFQVAGGDGVVYSGFNQNKSLRVQYSDVAFWNFLNEIGVYPCKSKTIQSVQVPKKYFKHFLRGVFDGDGSVYLHKDMRWRGTYALQISFASASKEFVLWLQNILLVLCKVRGYISYHERSDFYQLRYANLESSRLFDFMYSSESDLCLKRKKLKYSKSLGILQISKERRNPKP